MLRGPKGQVGKISADGLDFVCSGIVQKKGREGEGRGGGGVAEWERERERLDLM